MAQSVCQIVHHRRRVPDKLYLLPRHAPVRSSAALNYYISEPRAEEVKWRLATLIYVCSAPIGPLIFTYRAK